MGDQLKDPSCTSKRRARTLMHGFLPKNFLSEFSLTSENSAQVRQFSKIVNRQLRSELYNHHFKQ